MTAWARQLRYGYLAYFSKPVSEQILVRHVWKHKSCRLLEIGIGSGERAKRLIQLATAASPGSTILYTGIDPFELRTSGGGMSLKLAHRTLVATGAKVRLLPGEANYALPPMANSLGPHDLVLIAGDQTDESLARAWFYLPRVMAAEALVFRQAAGATGDEPWAQVEPGALARLTQRQHRTAA